MGEPERWEDAIDVDDSDLPSLLHPLPIPSQALPLSLPSLQPCSQLYRSAQTLAPTPRPPSPIPEAQRAASPLRTAANRRPIPGPAGVVQTAMHRKATMAATAAPHPRTTSFFEMEAREDEIPDFDEQDGDFKLNPWLCAMHFLGLRPDSAPPSPISSIKGRASAAQRVPQVVGIVISCAPNGLGDLFITLKDPTGTIGASVNRKVLLESDLGGDISVGCVLILKQVVVFCSGRSACYLNVTPNNVVKLVSKDCGPANQPVMPSLAARCGPSGSFMETWPGAVERACSVRQRTGTSADEARRNLNYKRMVNSEKTGEHREIGLGATAIVTSVRLRAETAADEVARDSNCERMTNSGKTGEHMGIRLGAEERAPSVRLRAEAIANETTRNFNCERLMNSESTGLTGSLSCSISAAAATTNMAADHRSREYMDIEPGTTEIRPAVRLGAETTDNEKRGNLNCERITNSGNTCLSRSTPYSISAAAATTVTAMPDLRANIAPVVRHRAETTADDPARRNLNCERMVNGRHTDPIGSLPCTIGSAMNATNVAAKPDHGTSEPKKLISKVSVAQWTDDQLLELFSDYQDDADLLCSI